MRVSEDAERSDVRLRFRARVHGRVQGVGFRYTACDVARSLGVVGYVSNHWDGTVAVVAEGPEGSLRRLLSWLHAGPRMAQVSRVDVAWEAPRSEFDGFEVRH